MPRDKLFLGVVGRGFVAERFFCCVSVCVAWENAHGLSERLALAGVIMAEFRVPS